MTTNIKINSIKGVMLFVLFTIFSFRSGVLIAQSSNVMKHRSQAGWKGCSRIGNKTIYKGFELSMAFPQYSLKSNIAAIDGMRVSYTGTNFGGVLANPIGKIKATVGAYQSNSSVSYDMKMTQASLTANIYVLRIGRVKYHTFEPYIIAGVAQQQTRFFGNYLPNADGTLTQYNYSSAEPPQLGKVNSTQANYGMGVEYQLVSFNTVFVHILAQATHGTSLSWNASKAYTGTSASPSTVFSLGVNFGMIK